MQNPRAFFFSDTRSKNAYMSSNAVTRGSKPRLDRDQWPLYLATCVYGNNTLPRLQAAGCGCVAGVRVVWSGLPFAKQRLRQQKYHKSEIADECVGTTCLNRDSTIAAAQSPTFPARVRVSTAVRPITSKLNISGPLSEQTPTFLGTHLQAFHFFNLPKCFNMFQQIRVFLTPCFNI